MKTLIIYFSQTGFTRKLAEQIRDGVEEVAGSCDLASLTGVNPESLADYDLVGLGCPVFYYNAPFNVRDFMQGLPELADKRWFVFCTHGAVMGNTLILVVVSIAPENYARYRQVLDEAAARGEFRWLVDPDSLDFDNPLHKQREREIKGKG